MKVCVFGAGAIGGYLAIHLAQVDGVEVSVVARGAHLGAIRRVCRPPTIRVNSARRMS
jgi:2-dehydropantoate 2-reductase